MSVLIDACCLVVQELSLSISYPGGATAFMADTRAAQGVKYVISDDALVAVCVHDPGQLQPLMDLLLDAGLSPSDEGEPGDFLIVDMELGMPHDCPWLVTDVHRHGFRTAWRPNKEHEPLVTPSQWWPLRSWQLLSYDLTELGPERAISLGTTDLGTEAVLDFQSGRVVNVRTDPSPFVHVSADGPVPLGASVADLDDRLRGAQEALLQQGIPHRVDRSRGVVSVLFATADEPDETECEESGPPNGDESPISRVASSGIDWLVRVEVRVPAPNPRSGCDLNDRLDFEVLLPIPLRPEHLADRAVIARLVGKARTSTCGTLDVDRQTGTMSVFTPLDREPDETWDEAAARGFAIAASKGEWMMRQALPWC